MNSAVRVTVVVENTAHDEGLASEHGLAIHIRRGNTTGLLDTGASDAVITNAATLGIDLTALDWVALSHGHYDHAGGLMAVLDQATGARLYLHRDALCRHVAVTEDGGRRFIGVPFGEQDLLDVAGPRLRWLNGPIELVPGV